jgi:hypothetical protein
MMDGEEVGSLYRNTNYGLTSAGRPKWQASLTKLSWMGDLPPTGLGFDVAGRDTAREVLAAWGHNADEVLDWRAGKPVRSMYSKTGVYQREMSVPEQHQERILRQDERMPPAMRGVMSPSRNQAGGTSARNTLRIGDQYIVRVVPSRHHSGYDALVISEGIGVVAEENGFPTEAKALAAGATTARLIARHGAIAPYNRAGGSYSFKTISGVKAANKELSAATGRAYWFDRQAMRFFNTRIESPLYGGRYFITSEAMDERDPRRYAIREALPDGRIETVGGIQRFRHKEDARDEIKSLLKGG